jgi:hypothetical protein
MNRVLLHLVGNISREILPVFFHVKFLGSQNVHCYLVYLCYGSNEKPDDDSFDSQHVAICITDNKGLCFTGIIYLNNPSLVACK